MTPDDSARNRKMRKIFFWFFFGRRPLPFGGSHLRLPSGPAGIRTTTGSPVSAGKTNAIPTEPSGRLPQDAQDDVTELFDLFDAHFWGWKGI